MKETSCTELKIDPTVELRKVADYAVDSHGVRRAVYEALSLGGYVEFYYNTNEAEIGINETANYFKQ